MHLLGILFEPNFLLQLFCVLDENANIPLGTSSLDVAQLLKVYFRSLPEPALTFELYDQVTETGGSNIQSVRSLMARLPVVNQATLECLCALLSGVSEKSAFNKVTIFQFFLLFLFLKE